MDYLYGKLNNKVPSFVYEGIKSTTAEVIVDNSARTITVNVLTDDTSSVASKDFVNTFAKKIESKIEESETGKYNLTLNLLDANNNIIDTSIVGLPEGGSGDDIVSGSYDSETEYITLVKKSGNKVEIDLSSIITDITALQNDYAELNTKVTGLDGRITANTSLINQVSADLSAHKDNKDNPHAVTKEQIGLDKVDNTSDLDKPVSTATQNAITNIQNTVDEQLSVIKAAVANKVDKVAGKELSSNDFTDEEKDKLTGIESGATKVEVDAALNSTSTNPVQNKIIYEALDNKVNKETGKGLSSNDFTDELKKKLVDLDPGASAVTIDAELSDTSENPVQNKVIYAALEDKVTVEEGKVLSSNDFTNDEKEKLANIEPNATKVIVDRVLDKDSDNAVSNKAVTNNINTLTGNVNNLQTAINDLQTSSTEAINTIKVNNVEITKENKSVNIATDEVSILYDDSKLHLPDAWITYLQKQTFAIPVITLGGISSRSVEWGASVSVAANTITHRETNIDNIKADTLKLYRNNVSVADLTPNTAATTIDYAINEAVTNNVSFIVKCTDTMNNTRQSSTVTYSAYKPCYYGALDADSITSVDGLTKKASGSLGTVTFTSTDGQYGYLVTAGNITSVTSGGFPVPGEKMQDITVTLNGLSVTYHVWRCSSSIAAGSNTWVVA